MSGCTEHQVLGSGCMENMGRNGLAEVVNEQQTLAGSSHLHGKKQGRFPAVCVGEEALGVETSWKPA